MKKVLKSGILALALMAGVSTAFAAANLHPSVTFTTYNCTGQAGTFNGSIDAAMEFYGCSGSAQVCATCTNVNNPNDIVTLRHNQ